MQIFPRSVSEGNKLYQAVLFPNTLLMSSYAECSLGQEADTIKAVWQLRQHPVLMQHSVRRLHGV